MKTKKFNVTYEYSVYGTVEIDVPAEMDFNEAIKYAEENIDTIPLPDDPEYIDGSCIVDKENCDFAD